MKRAYLDDADQEKVAETVRDAVKARGALVTEATHSHVRFEGWNADTEWSFEKGGYVGVYQHTGEQEVRLVARVEATTPARVFWTTLFVETALIVGFFLYMALSSFLGIGSVTLDSTTAILAAALLWTVFLVALLVYLGTIASSRRAEGKLLDGLLETLRAHPEAAKAVFSERERTVQEFEEKLEGELAKRKLKGTP
ncbi:MAG: sulfite exporter TauE/SafE family protein [Thermoplasmatota archaeon]